MRKLALVGLFIALVTLVLVSQVWGLPPYSPPTITANVVKVVDGDTIDVQITKITGTAPVKVGDTIRVRYIGMNTPETKDPRKPVEYFGKEASAFNASLVAGKTVYLELDVQTWGPYDRLLAYVYLDPQGYAMVNAILVAMGFANVATYPPNVRYVKVFQQLEKTARELKLGLWAPREDESASPQQPQKVEGCFAWLAFHYDASGNDNYNLNDEFFTLKNVCDHAIDLTGWTVSDAASHIFTFPSGFTLAPNAQVTIYTGSGVDTADKLYWGSKRAIWNNNGDVATLRDAAGRVIKSYSY